MENNKIQREGEREVNKWEMQMRGMIWNAND